jgi:hypothetical protein
MPDTRAQAKEEVVASLRAVLARHESPEAHTTAR